MSETVDEEVPTAPHWRCSAESVRPASEWIAGHAPPADLAALGEFDLDQHDALSWRDRRRIDSTEVALDSAAPLAELGLHPRWGYHTAVVGVRIDWEMWLSEDGVTSASFRGTDDGWEMTAIETRFAGPRLLMHTTGPIPTVSWIECASMPADTVAGYVEHRRNVADRVEHGAVALSIADTRDELGWRNYQALLRTKSPEVGVDGELADAFGKLGEYFRWILGLTALIAVVAAANVVIHWADYADWLSLWWPLAILVVLPRTCAEYAGLLFTGNLNRLDHKFPDDLDAHAGFWVKGKIGDADLRGTVEVGRAKESFLRGIDAYLPLREKIILGDRTYAKQDPAFWAIAAHELGHAIVYDRVGSLGRFSLMCRTLVSPAHSYVVAGLLMNSLFGWDSANDALFWVIAAAVGFGSVVLIDEAIASIIALRILRSDDRLDAAVLGELRTHLALAWLTYFSGTAVMIGLLVGWPWIAAFIEATAQFSPADPLIPGGAVWPNIMAAVVAVAVVATQGFMLVRRFRSTDIGDADATEIAEEEPARPMFCARCGEKFAAEVQDCPNDGAPLVDVGDDPDGTMPKKEPPNIKAGLGCLGILAVVGSMIGFGVTVWDQPLGTNFRVAVFLYGTLVASVAFAPVTALVHSILAIPRKLIVALGVVPKPPKAAGALRSARAAADTISEIKVIDPRQRGPWYLSLNPGLWFFALPLVVLWFMAQM